MGHRDIEPSGAPQRESDAAPDAAGAAQSGVRVWGDIAHPLVAGDESLPDAAAPGRHASTESPSMNADSPLSANAPSGTPASSGEDLYHRVGHLTRTLHDALRELGYEESLNTMRGNLPDARDRLAYITRLTGEAAEKVLNSVDRARSIQDAMGASADSLRLRWAAVAAYTDKGGRATPAGETLVRDTSDFLAHLGDQAGSTNAILTEIMLAQDFHDLTGQVIRKVVDLAQSLEEQLLQLLIETQPAEPRPAAVAAAPSGVLEGPVVSPENRTDVVTDQAGVDDLLASLGF